MAYMKVALAYGSNLGNRSENITLAVDKLKENGLGNICCSKHVVSKPVDCPQGSGDFLNGALTGEWQGSCRELLDLCQKIEGEVGRSKVREINSPRPIDLDILLFGEEMFAEEDLKVPHERMLQRGFVMGPLAEVAADWIIPGEDSTVGQYFKGMK
ncbi:MAG: 2-amino-4-hydroxy-6-hydroxymethyldihydropteridine diphosphokinase [Lentisphaerales bacterium]|nr:2-amino-4-hydroxy-6-hydroxymethyldihydropteridine diphosphokinase [Lentisphaerales bacterium]